MVSPDNPVKTLSRTQLADLFLGRTDQFPDGRRAVPLDQAESSPAREAFNERVLNRSAAQVRAHWAKAVFTGRGRPPRNVADCDEVKAAVAGDSRAIGYIDASQVDASVAVVRLL